MGRRTIRAAITGVVVLLLTAGCAASPRSPRPPIDGLTDVVRPVWQIDVRLVGDPVVRDGVVASYVRGGSTGLQVRAWSLADGHELWQHAAYIGSAPEGEPLSLAAVRVGDDELVAFLSPTGLGTPSELVVAGLATGDPGGIRRPVVQATSRIDSCGHEVCFEGWSLETQHLREAARPSDSIGAPARHAGAFAERSRARAPGSRIRSAARSWSCAGCTAPHRRPITTRHPSPSSTATSR